MEPLQKNQLLQDLNRLNPGTLAYAQLLRNVLSVTELTDQDYQSVMQQWFNKRKQHLDNTPDISQKSDYAAVLVPRITLGKSEMNLQSLLPGIALFIGIPLLLGLNALSIILTVILAPISVVLVQRWSMQDRLQRLKRLGLPQEATSPWFEVKEPEQLNGEENDQQTAP